MKGRLIVIEGTDGSGKTTQLHLLQTALKKDKKQIRTLRFPQYKNTFFGKTIAKMLRGEIAPLSEINPYLISTVYAMDRAEARDKLYKWLNNGKVVILDRYVTSNMAHQCGRLPVKDQGKFLKWIDELEYRVNNVPREDTVIYLHMPYEKSLELMENKDRENRAYAKGRKKDMVESNTDYMKRAEKAYMRLVKKYPSHWIQIECLNDKGDMRSREDIHEEIKETLRKRHIL